MGYPTSRHGSISVPSEQLPTEFPFIPTILRFMIGVDGEENVPHVAWLRTFSLVVDQFKKEHPDFFDAKVRGFLSEW